MGLLRRISDTPNSHRSPPQRLMTLIKRPSQRGRDGSCIILGINTVKGDFEFIPQAGGLYFPFVLAEAGTQQFAKERV